MKGRVHLVGHDDGVVSVAPLTDRCGGCFRDLIDQAPLAEQIAAQHAETIVVQL